MATSKVADQEKQPLLEPSSLTSDPNSSSSSSSSSMTPMQKAITQTFKSTADIAKHLPTGTVLVFQVLSPVFTNQGHCDATNRTMTASLISLAALVSFFVSFTDSFRDAAGQVRYAVATPNGLWVIDGSPPPEPEIAKTYRLKFIDFLHAVISLMVFAAVTLFDKNVEGCFYPVMSDDMKQVLTAVPLAAGVIGGGLCVLFPSTRHGIGFPLSSV